MFDLVNHSMRNLIYCCLFSLLLSSCKKSSNASGQNVEFHLLQSYQFVTGKCQVNAATAILKPTPLIANNEIISYDPDEFTFTVSAAAGQRVREMGGRTPFAITVDSKVIYYGVYMPSIMSSTCDASITMDNLLAGNNKLSMRLGYPWQMGVSIDDNRNDALLVATLRKQGKIR